MTDGDSVSLAWTRNRGGTALSITGLPLRSGRPPPGLAVLPAELVPAALKAPGLQSIAGRFTATGEGLRFTPRLPFMDGTAYALVQQGPDGPRVWTIERPARDLATTTTVTGLHPTSASAPLNLLKLYVQFSAPMSEGCSAEGVEVRREDTGELLEDVFFRGRYELWDPGRRRLTLLLDPGRIKRGLGPHVAKGYPLVQGVRVRVSITSRFRDARGAPLAETAERSYLIGPPVRRHVDPTRWRVRWPAAGSAEPLSVTFERPLDHALLQHALQAADASGAPVAGEVVVGRSEKSWRFHPRSPWDAARYDLLVDPRLEDLAGNSVMRVFDRDLARAGDTPSPSAEPVRFSRLLIPAANFRADKAARREANAAAAKSYGPPI